MNKVDISLYHNKLKQLLDAAPFVPVQDQNLVKNLEYHGCITKKHTVLGMNIFVVNSNKI